MQVPQLLDHGGGILIVELHQDVDGLARQAAGVVGHDLDPPKLEPRPEWRRFRQSFEPSQVEVIVLFPELLKESSDPADSIWFKADAGLSGLWNR